MKHQTVHTSGAPEAIGPYSQATSYNGMVYCSGQIGIDPETGDFVEGGVQDQTVQVLKNLSEVLNQADSSLAKVLRCTIFLESMDDFAVVNQVYGQYFSPHKPARETVAVKTLPKNAKVEISCIAYI